MNTKDFTPFLFAFAITSCNNATQPTSPVGTQASDTMPVETQSDTIYAVPDSVSSETFLRSAKENCGLDLDIDPNKWLPQEFVYRNVENAMSAVYYTKDDTDLEAFLDNFLQQCIDASVVKAIGTDPKCGTVAEARDRLIEKHVKHDRNPAEGYCYMGEIIYVHDNHKVIVTINFGKYANNLTTLYFKVRLE